MNCCQFIGFTLNDVTLKEYEYGEGDNKTKVPQAYFNLSVKKVGTTPDGKVRYDSFPFKAVGKLAEFLKNHLKKGMRVGIQASCESSRRQSPTGKWYESYIFRVVAVHFIDKPDYEMEELTYDENLYVDFQNLD